MSASQQKNSEAGAAGTKPPRVIVVISGGNFQDVAMSETVDFDVLDYDNYLDCDATKPEIDKYRRLEREVAELHGEPFNKPTR